VVLVSAGYDADSNGAHRIERGNGHHSGLWWLSPRVTWYVGASGVSTAHGPAELQSILDAHLGPRDTVFRNCALNGVGGQGLDFPRPLWLSMRIYMGAACGFAVGAALSLRMHNSPPLTGLRILDFP